MPQQQQQQQQGVPRTGAASTHRGGPRGSPSVQVPGSAEFINSNQAFQLSDVFQWMDGFSSGEDGDGAVGFAPQAFPTGMYGQQHYHQQHQHQQQYQYQQGAGAEQQRASGATSATSSVDSSTGGEESVGGQGQGQAQGQAKPAPKKTKSRKRGGGTGEPKLRKACEFCTIKKIKYVSRGRVGDLPGGR